MAQLGWRRTDLATRLNVSRGAITNMLQGKYGASELVPRVAALLEIPMPILGTDEELADMTSKLTPEQREAVKIILRGMLGLSESRTDDDK